MYINQDTFENVLIDLNKQIRYFFNLKSLL